MGFWPARGAQWWRGQSASGCQCCSPDWGPAPCPVLVLQTEDWRTRLITKPGIQIQSPKQKPSCLPSGMRQGQVSSQGVCVSGPVVVRRGLFLSFMTIVKYMSACPRSERLSSVIKYGKCFKRRLNKNSKSQEREKAHLTWVFGKDSWSIEHLNLYLDLKG